MDENLLKEKINLYETKEISWLDLAPYLIEAVDQEFDFDYIKFDRRKVSSITKAFKFLKVQRSESLNDSKTKDIQPEFISYLLVIFKRMDDISRETKFQQLIDDVLSGKAGRAVLTDISKKFKSNRNINAKQVVKETVEEILPIDAFKSAIKTLTYIIEKTKEEFRIEKIREILGEECRDLANELQCIADEEFEQLWNKRREFEV